ncbi:hypothetical protein A2U01_0115074, partial [Trifolium medium]|nr:hypothetical protein [Trifolium medium]
LRSNLAVTTAAAQSPKLCVATSVHVYKPQRHLLLRAAATNHH